MQSAAVLSVLLFLQGTFRHSYILEQFIYDTDTASIPLQSTDIKGCEAYAVGKGQTLQQNHIRRLMAALSLIKSFGNVE